MSVSISIVSGHVAVVSVSIEIGSGQVAVMSLSISIVSGQVPVMSLLTAIESGSDACFALSVAVDRRGDESESVASAIARGQNAFVCLSIGTQSTQEAAESLSAAMGWGRDASATRQTATRGPLSRERGSSTPVEWRLLSMFEDFRQAVDKAVGHDAVVIEVAHGPRVGIGTGCEVRGHARSPAEASRMARAPMGLNGYRTATPCGRAFTGTGSFTSGTVSASIPSSPTLSVCRIFPAVTLLSVVTR
jgi:hypothetical protein